jgi:predicted hotdog family 3-hydroxylacyl-ACP dehydratase
MKPDLPWTLEDLVPHAPPMILIDHIHACESEGLEATVRISEDSPFFEPRRGVPSYVGIEYVAQTVAALAGLRARRSGQDISLGFLLGTRRFDASLPYFILGSELTIQVEPEFEARNVAKYLGRITDETGETIVTTSVTVYLRGATDERRIDERT